MAEEIKEGKNTDCKRANSDVTSFINSFIFV